MKTRLILSFVATVVLALLLRWQGAALVTPVSPYGIIDLEFAWHAEKLRQLQLFWPREVLSNNIYIDFLFLVAYGIFLYTACQWRAAAILNQKAAAIFATLAVSAASLDLLENFLMLLVWYGRFQPFVLKIIAVVAGIKFFLVIAVLLFLFASFFMKRRKKEPTEASA